MLPSKSLPIKNEESTKGYKKSKDQITTMAWSNASGKHKFPFVVVGKSKNPRAFKNINQDPLSAFSINSIIFKNWFFKSFVAGVKKFKKGNGSPTKAVSFLIDNAIHPNADLFVSDGITVKFLLPNVTAPVQPMDQGILENIKKVYRREMLNQLIEDDGEDSVVEILSPLTQCSATLSQPRHTQTAHSIFAAHYI